MTNLLIVAALALHMAKKWNTCPRCGRSYQSVTNLPCGIGDCKPSGGDPNKGQPKGRTHKITKGSGPSSQSGYVEHKDGCLDGCGFLVLVGTALLAGVVKLVRLLRP